MKPDGDRGVQAWLDEQIAETLYITSISVSELLLGIELLPGGKRKEGTRCRPQGPARHSLR